MNGVLVDTPVWVDHFRNRNEDLVGPKRATFDGAISTPVTGMNKAKIRVTALALVVAVMLAWLSVFVERVGPELVQYGDADYRPILKGGFPVAYLFDSPGISVERQLSFFEDKLSLGALLLDMTIYFALGLLANLVVYQRRRHVHDGHR